MGNKTDAANDPGIGYADTLDVSGGGAVDRSLSSLDLTDLRAGGTVKAGYRVLGRLGAGGLGAVFLALDVQRGENVALKRLHKIDPSGLLRLKNEFRRVQDLAHPNLVQLHELIEDEGDWYLILEYVDGGTFQDWVWHGRAPRAVLDTPVTDGDVSYSEFDWAPDAEPDYERLRDAIRQLAEGVSALHAGGLLHRDLKPGNVLVDRQGRVKILDFGLVEELATAATGDEPTVAGTPAYMAPEQAGGREVTEAADWYAVGVMLYEAMTGQLPFTGSLVQLIYRKQTAAPPRPSDICPVPADLEALCVALMQPRAEERPTGPQVLAWLGAAAPGLGRDRQESFVGQDRPLGELKDALDRTRDGVGTFLVVEGPSGVGKSALLASFLADLDDDVLVLTGRCYERETVPYKGFDQLVDALSEHLAGLPQEELQPLIPREAHELVRVFPILERIDAFTRGEPLRTVADDLQEVRRRAFVGLRSLLARMANRRRMVLVVDDLQWADLDSARLLVELLTPPDPPALLFLGCARPESTSSPFLGELRRWARGGEGRIAVERLQVEPLPHRVARSLALRRLGRDDDVAQRRAEAIARESEGNPYLLTQLVRHALENSLDDSGVHDRGLADVIGGRIGRLEEEDLALLEAVAVAGQPIPQRLALAAAGGVARPLSTFARLRGADLVRTHGARDADHVEPFHDRVREQVVGSLTADRLQLRHRALAEALVEFGETDPEPLARHFAGAGDSPRAARYARDAARRALETLAFERAAEFLALALDGEEDGHERRRLQVQRAEALAATGRCAEAAPLLLDAAGPRGGMELRTRAAELLLTSGRAGSGLDHLRAVLKDARLSVPSSDRFALVSASWAILRELVRGVRLTERPDEEVLEADRRRIDLAWSAGRGLLLWRELHAVLLLIKSLALARKAGDGRRYARGLIARAMIIGGFVESAAEKGLQKAEELAERLDDDYLRGFARVTRGVNLSHRGHWSEGLAMLDDGQTLLRERCVNVAWEVSIAVTTMIRAMMHLGAVRELDRLTPRWMREAADRGDIYLGAVAGISDAWLRLVDDDVDGARRAIATAEEGWPEEVHHYQRFQSLVVAVRADLYEGLGPQALARLEDAWGWLLTSYIPYSPDTRAEIRLLWAQCLLAAATEADDPKPLLRRARGYGRKLRRDQHRDGRGAEAYVEAVLHHHAGSPDKARLSLDRAASHWDALGRKLHAGCVRRRKALLLDGEGLEQADAALRELGVAVPSRFADAYLPGF